MSDRSKSPVSRTGTPGLNNPNIAPQHLFDSVAIDSHAPFHSPSIPQYPYRAASPSASSVNGSHLEPPPTYEAHTALKTRVSELEVINDLFRGRVAELEASEQDARRNETLARKAEGRIRIDLEEAKRKIEELESELTEYRDIGHKHKKARPLEAVDLSRASTPLSDPSQSTLR